MLEIIYVVLTVLGILAIGFILGNKLKKKELLSDRVVDMTSQLFVLAKIITLKTIEDEKTKDKLYKIFDSIHGTFIYTYLMTEETSIEEKKELTKQEVLNKLEEFGIEIDNEDKMIIDFLIENFVNLLPEEIQ